MSLFGSQTYLHLFLLCSHLNSITYTNDISSIFPIYLRINLNMHHHEGLSSERGMHSRGQAKQALQCQGFHSRVIIKHSDGEKHVSVIPE